MLRSVRRRKTLADDDANELHALFAAIQMCELVAIENCFTDDYGVQSPIFNMVGLHVLKLPPKYKLQR